MALAISISEVAALAISISEVVAILLTFLNANFLMKIINFQLRFKWDWDDGFAPNGYQAIIWTNTKIVGLKCQTSVKPLDETKFQAKISDTIRCQ